MPSISHTLRMRHRRDQSQRLQGQRLEGGLLGCGVLLSLFVAIAAILLTFAYANITAGLPSPDNLPFLLEPPNGLLLQPTRLYDRSGEHVIRVLENPAVTERKYIPLDESRDPHLPPILGKAILAVLDPNFWSHPGFTLQDPRQGSRPTLAQRLVGDLLLWDEPPGLRRALWERLLAAQITARYGREKVLEWYLNSAHYGRLAFGAEAAARAFFGKTASDLTLAEVAVLAAAAEAPALNPLDAPQAALERQKQVLQVMLDHGLISANEFRQTSQEELHFRQAHPSALDLSPVFTNLVLEQLGILFDPDRLTRGGLRIVTTLDYDLQIQATCATSAQVSRLGGTPIGESLTADGSPCHAASLLPTISLSNRPETVHLAANVVVLDPTTGQLLAMVGEPSPGLNSAQLPGHPPGTLLTPFIYLTAFTRGLNPASLLWDVPSNLPEALPDLSNLGRTFHGPVRLRMALANDYLVPALQVLHQMGLENAWRTTQQLGLVSLRQAQGRLFEPTNGGNDAKTPLDSGRVTLLEASRAFGVLANQGLLVGQALRPDTANNGSNILPPQVVLQVATTQGEDWLDCSGQYINCNLHTRPVISPQLAYLITHILSDETSRWPSLGHPNPLEIGRPAGAKIGRASTGDTWTVGYTPRLVVGVWMGSKELAVMENRPNHYETGAAGLWHAVIQYAARGTQPEGWSPPPGISTIEVCDPSGMLPTPDCPTVVEEVFLSGSEPTHPDTLFRSFQINRETGQLATMFTPPELIEERVYMVVPPAAAQWAKESGLPTPPQGYDRITAPASQPENARITSPEMFATVSGPVVIQGRATAEDFTYYRLQFGHGLNPLTWLQIGEDVITPVSKGRLAIWDTSGLNGLYALQLLVVGKEQRVETTTIQVTVDNRPPEVSIRFPSPEQHFTFPQDDLITFQVDASDELEMAGVEFYLNGRLITRLTGPPYSAPWEARIGQYILRVRAIDRGGNYTEDSVGFAVNR